MVPSSAPMKVCEHSNYSTVFRYCQSSIKGHKLRCTTCGTVSRRDCSYTECINPLTPNDPYMGRTATLTSKHCILCIYSTNIGAEYFKHALYSPLFSLQNAVCFIMLTCSIPVLFTFYIQSVLKLKKNKSGAQGLTLQPLHLCVCCDRINVAYSTKQH